MIKEKLDTKPSVTSTSRYSINICGSVIHVTNDLGEAIYGEFNKTTQLIAKNQDDLDVAGCFFRHGQCRSLKDACGKLIAVDAGSGKGKDCVAQVLLSQLIKRSGKPYTIDHADPAQELKKIGQKFNLNTLLFETADQGITADRLVRWAQDNRIEITIMSTMTEKSVGHKPDEKGRPSIKVLGHRGHAWLLVDVNATNLSSEKYGTVGIEDRKAYDCYCPLCSNGECLKAKLEFPDHLCEKCGPIEKRMPFKEYQKSAEYQRDLRLMENG